MQNDFDDWNEIKKKIEINHKERPCKFPKEREVWICILGKNVGWEQNGTGTTFSRPILILKIFNNQMLWGVPLSSKQKSLDFYFNFIDPYNRKVSVILAQLKLISIKRLDRKIYVLPKSEFHTIKNDLKNLL
jgi:mRNA-degrading endonuclease toxin of MazEF toxin-antitoxin module